MEEHLAPLADDVQDEIALADGAAAGEHDEVVPQALVQGGVQRRERVARGGHGHRDAAMLDNHGGDA